MEKSSKVIVISGIVILFALFVAYGLYTRSDQKAVENGISNQINSVESSALERQGPTPTVTQAPVPKNIKVTEPGDKITAGIAVPITVQPAAPGVSAKFRAFNIKAEKNKFDPSTVIVKVGDTVHINFTAVDKTYDFVLPDYGMIQTAGPGETRIVEFQALTQGKYIYYCKLCGGLDSTAVGYVIVAP